MAKEKEKELKKMSRLDSHWHYAFTATVRQTKEILKVCYQNPKLRRWAILLVGESGIGKNQLIEQAAVELGVSSHWFPCKGIAPEDFRMPLPVHSIKKKKYEGAIEGLTELLSDYCSTEQSYKYKMIKSFEDIMRPDYKGIVHLDEIVQASKDVQDMLYMFYYDRRIDDNKLSDGAMIVLSMNPPQLSEYMLNTLDHPSVDRVMLIKVVGDANEWVEWAGPAGVDIGVIDFVIQHAGCYDRNKGRRLEHLSDAVKAFGDVDPTNISYTLKVMVQGCIDNEYANMFINFMQEIYSVSGLAILLGDTKAFALLKKMAKNTGGGVAQMPRIQDEVIRAVKDPAKYLPTLWESMKDEGERWRTIAYNILEFARVIQKNNLDMIIGFLKALSDQQVKELDMGMDAVLKDPANILLVKEVWRCISPEASSQPGPSPLKMEKAAGRTV